MTSAIEGGKEIFLCCHLILGSAQHANDCSVCAARMCDDCYKSHLTDIYGKAVSGRDDG